MSKLFIMRHAESEANQKNLLAGHQDFPLSAKGIADAESLAQLFLQNHAPSIAYCSPLVRALQTARPFVIPRPVPLIIDRRLIEQDIGIFTGKSYEDVEGDPLYEKDRTKRWDWLPPQGESYRMIAVRLTSFFKSLPADGPDCLVITHAVTMRVMSGLLNNTLPEYPSSIPKNGEIWEVDFHGLENIPSIKSLQFDSFAYMNSRA
ncbi:MAG: histidine phosphatase family protein [Sphaerochaetaceae bacterium]